MSELRTTDGVNWIDLPDKDDLRRIFAECKQDGKDYYEELKARGIIVNPMDLFNEKRDAKISKEQIDTL